MCVVLLKMYLVWWGGNITGYQKSGPAVHTTGWPRENQRALRAQSKKQRCDNDCILLQMMQCHWISSRRPIGCTTGWPGNDQRGLRAQSEIQRWDTSRIFLQMTVIHYDVNTSTIDLGPMCVRVGTALIWSCCRGEKCQSFFTKYLYRLLEIMFQSCIDPTCRVTLSFIYFGAYGACRCTPWLSAGL